jgi:antitoxin VapB
MNDQNENQLREMQQGFRHAVPMAEWPNSTSGAQNPMRAKVFKSGNSLALRLPAALGLEAGMEMAIASDGAGGYHLRRAPAVTRKFNIDAIWGIAKDLDLKPMAPDDRMFDTVKRPWDDPDWPGWRNDDA